MNRQLKQEVYDFINHNRPRKAIKAQQWTCRGAAFGCGYRGNRIQGRLFHRSERNCPLLHGQVVQTTKRKVTGRTRSVEIDASEISEKMKNQLVKRYVIVIEHGANVEVEFEPNAQTEQHEDGQKKQMVETEKKQLVVKEKKKMLKKIPFAKLKKLTKGEVRLASKKQQVMGVETEPSKRMTRSQTKKVHQKEKTDELMNKQPIELKKRSSTELKTRVEPESNEECVKRSLRPRPVKVRYY